MERRTSNDLNNFVDFEILERDIDSTWPSCSQVHIKHYDVVNIDICNFMHYFFLQSCFN